MSRRTRGGRSARKLCCNSGSASSASTCARKPARDRTSNGQCGSGSANSASTCACNRGIERRTVSAAPGRPTSLAPARATSVDRTSNERSAAGGRVRNRERNGLRYESSASISRSGITCL
eukprot:1176421-Prorocentrum_minimum.AAC.2